MTATPHLIGPGDADTVAAPAATAPGEDVPATVTWGLFAAFAVHDLEELFTMADWSAERARDLRENHPWVPEGVVSFLEFDQRQLNTAITLMALLMAVAAADGARTGGRSAFYQTMLAGFGLHSITHLAQSAVQRGYTPGVVTAPLVVAPFSWWAWRRLRRAGVLRETTTTGTVATLALMPAGIAGVHVAAYGLNRLVDRWRRRRR